MLKVLLAFALMIAIALTVFGCGEPQPTIQTETTSGSSATSDQSSSTSTLATTTSTTSTLIGTVINVNSAVNVRSGPGTSYSILGTAAKGSTWTVIAKTGDWYKIDYEGETGYIRGDYLSVE
jgi:uncharacterized protein YgiM (DUF1202 family)